MLLERTYLELEPYVNYKAHGTDIEKKRCIAEMIEDFKITYK